MNTLMHILTNLKKANLKSIRIFFLRVLISWWTIIGITLIVLPMMTLIYGKNAFYDYKDVVRMLWYGDL